MKDEEERDNKRDISVIIPVYNVEKYIDQCLDSLQAQSFDNFEVICVDDGSLDHTVDRIREHMKTDPRIRLIEMPHCGLAGVMRNEGIKRAEGKYCLFLDGDDFFERDMLKKIRQIFVSLMPDFIMREQRYIKRLITLSRKIIFRKVFRLRAEVFLIF